MINRLERLVNFLQRHFPGLQGVYQLEDKVLLNQPGSTMWRIGVLLPGVAIPPDVTKKELEVGLSKLMEQEIRLVFVDERGTKEPFTRLFALDWDACAQFESTKAL